MVSNTFGSIRQTQKLWSSNGEPTTETEKRRRPFRKWARRTRVTFLSQKFSPVEGTLLHRIKENCAGLCWGWVRIIPEKQKERGSKGHSQNDMLSHPLRDRTRAHPNRQRGKLLQPASKIQRSSPLMKVKRDRSSPEPSMTAKEGEGNGEAVV